MTAVTLRRVIRCLLVAVCSLLAAGAASAGAVESKPFGITKFSMQWTHTVERVEGRARIFENIPYTFTQAGGHPEALTTTIRFAAEEHEELSGGKILHYAWPTRDPKDVVVDLPPGLLGDPMAVPRCTLTLLLGERRRCPADTQVGFARVRLGGSEGEILVPIVNMTPEAGQSAEFAIENAANFPFLETGHLVRTAAGYGFAVTGNNLPSQDPVVEVEQTFWGVPADANHDSMRGLFCETSSSYYEPLCSVSEEGTAYGGGQPSGLEPVPFLTMWTDCAAGSEEATIRADSWEEPGSVGLNGAYRGYLESTPPVKFPAVTGCNLLKFEPTVDVKPTTLVADEPVGLGVHLTIPLDENPEADATPQLRRSVITLPEGMSVSPGVVDGVRACEKSGPEGIDIEGSGSEGRGENGELELVPGHCPEASIIGTAEAITPFLPVPVEGHVYLAKPECGGPGEAPCTEEDARDGKLYKLYLELGGTHDFAQTGIEFKVEGDVQVDPATGQLTTVFDNLVQAPYSEVKIELNGGPRASLANPAVCGFATTTTDLTPWSAPGNEGLLTAGTPDATPFSRFMVEGCAKPTPFAPGFLAGTVTPQAGQFTSFTMDLSRQDREQYAKGIQIHTPPGLSGTLSSVPLCGEPQADDGQCSESSKIGTTRVATGAGSDPFEIEGNVYLTGPHDGDPFGLSIVVHVVAGPFNLGIKVVRARIAVDPENSTLTVTTDETGPYAVPQIVFGVPVRLKRVTVDINRPKFMFNPTNCNAQEITANISGSQNGVADVSSPFAVAGCKSLGFKPEFKVSTSAHTSRADGASLDAKLSYPAGSFGSDANIARVKVDLPKQLPSRLTTLQKACPAAEFDSNPALCPAGSVVGVVRASTPLLPVELSGPVYFVSHGGEAFPSLIIVLQGDGVRVDLTATTFISKAGITSSTFKTVPDVPVNTFELFLPEGKNSALAANGNLCDLKQTVTTKRKVIQHVDGRTVHKTVVTHKTEPGSLIMPTEMVSQNGMVLKENTKIAVTGCAVKGKAKATRRTSGRAGR